MNHGFDCSGRLLLHEPQEDDSTEVAEVPAAMGHLAGAGGLGSLARLLPQGSLVLTGDQVEQILP